MIKSTKNEEAVTIDPPERDNEGYYPFPVALVEGENHITVIAVNEYGYSNDILCTVFCIVNQGF